jgi:hypothetical protein
MLGVVKISPSLNSNKKSMILLIAARRERVKQFYAEGRVFKGSYKAKEVDI